MRVCGMKKVAPIVPNREPAPTITQNIYFYYVNYTFLEPRLEPNSSQLQSPTDRHIH